MSQVVCNAPRRPGCRAFAVRVFMATQLSVSVILPVKKEVQQLSQTCLCLEQLSRLSLGSPAWGVTAVSAHLCLCAIQVADSFCNAWSRSHQAGQLLFSLQDVRHSSSGRSQVQPDESPCGRAGRLYFGASTRPRFACKAKPSTIAAYMSDVFLLRLARGRGSWTEGAQGVCCRRHPAHTSAPQLSFASCIV